jgi:hypothetical protein
MDIHPNEYMLYSLVVKPHQRKKLAMPLKLLKVLNWIVL